jgi:outer membrane receptor for ferrienterochelin and colicins
MKKCYFLLLNLFFISSFSQAIIKGKITSNNEPLAFATIMISTLNIGVSADENGFYKIENVPSGTITLQFSHIGHKAKQKLIFIINEEEILLDIDLEVSQSLDEVVVTGTLKAVSRLESPVPVEVITKIFLKQNPTPSLFEALQNVNGLRPQNNCNICNTGDIRINGLDGPYTMVTIDGMPIVSALGTVYGLSGIPNSMIERIEVIKGAASTLYGSEAVGGVINIITKKGSNVPLFTADAFSTSWLENNIDLGYKASIGKNVEALIGVNYFKYNNPIDNNNDNFTDMALQDRVSFFSKWNLNRKSGKEFNIVARYLYEDRWGGQMQWNPSYRGGEEVYGESIYTSRYELLGKYQLPTIEKMFLQFSLIGHDQNSVYGNAVYLANQKIAFGQFLWDKNIKNHSLLFGSAIRYQLYNDNTPATVTSDRSTIYSVFVQDEINSTKKFSTLLGLRYDYNSAHGSIVTPRLALKFKPSEQDILRLNFGTGFRVVNLFTEDHQALSGARDVVIANNLKPETSYNASLNYLKKINTVKLGTFIWETSTWLTYFTNRIIPDYDLNPNQIIYDNLNGYSQILGLSSAVDWILPYGIKATIGASLFDPVTKQDNRKFVPLFTERYSVNWAIGYDIPKWFLTIDYTGNLTGSMRLPLLSELDPRREFSLPFSIQNIQITYKKFHNFELYGGVKNILNWTPNNGNPFLIARANDPFDANVQFDPSGNAISTPNNPFALTFDPTYAFGPNQGIRAFLGIRFHLD